MEGIVAGLTLREAIEEGLKAKRGEVQETTHTGYQDRLNPYLDWCKKKKIADMPIREFKKIHVQMYLNHLGASKPKGLGLKPTSVHNSKLAISAIMGKLSAMGIIERNFVREIKTKKNRPEKNAPFTREEIKKIKEYCLEHDTLLYNFIRFVFYSFMRNKEVVRTQLKHIDMGNRTIAVKTKTDSMSHILMVLPIDGLSKGDRDRKVSKG